MGTGIMRKSYRNKSKHFVVEIDAWGDWVVEGAFNTFKEAKAFGERSFPQNTWRIKNLLSGRVVYTFDHTVALEEDARTDMARLINHSHLMNDYFNRQEERAERVARLAVMRENFRRELEIQRRIERSLTINWMQDGF
jgi:hypothetical protein